MFVEAAGVIHDDKRIALMPRDDNTATAIPDSAFMWNYIWAASRSNQLLGVAHTHPGSGLPHPSSTDLATFEAIERGLGRGVVWWILSADQAIVIIRTPSPSMTAVVVTHGDACYAVVPVADPWWASWLRTASKAGA